LGKKPTRTHDKKKIGQKPGPKHFENATATSSSEGVLKHLKTETVPLQPSIVGAE